MSGTNTTNTGTIAVGFTLTGDTTFTNTESGFITASDIAVYGTGTSNTVINAGGILGADAGVSMVSGGAVTNQSTGTIQGAIGVELAVYGGTVINRGLINAYGNAVVVEPGGTVDNQAGGQISAGAQGIVVGGAPGSVNNQGTVSAVGTHAAAA